MPAGNREDATSLATDVSLMMLVLVVRWKGGARGHKQSRCELAWHVAVPLNGSLAFRKPRGSFNVSVTGLVLTVAARG